MKAPSLTIYGHSFAVAASARAQTARFEKQKRSTKRHVRWKTVISRAQWGWKGFLREIAG
jgi:hypothetical protein